MHEFIAQTRDFQCHQSIMCDFHDSTNIFWHQDTLPAIRADWDSDIISFLNINQMEMLRIFNQTSKILFEILADQRQAIKVEIS